MPAPVYDWVVHYPLILGSDITSTLRIQVYPLQRVSGSLLLTVDITPVDPKGAGLWDYFDYIGSGIGNRLGAMRAASLVDTQSLVRYGPLRMHSVSGDAYSSVLPMRSQTSGVTYRLGAFFPDPGPGVGRLTVDLQRAGMVPDVPIVSGTQPAAELVSGDTSAPAAAVSPSGSSLVTYPVPAPAAMRTWIAVTWWLRWPVGR
jgi:hypothetical protein